MLQTSSARVYARSYVSHRRWEIARNARAQTSA